MSHANPLIQCPRCDLGGDIGCPCCGGEGLIPKFDAQDWLNAEALRVEWEEADHVFELEVVQAESLEEPSALEEFDARTSWEEIPEAGEEEAAAQWVRQGAGVYALMAGLE